MTKPENPYPTDADYLADVEKLASLLGDLLDKLNGDVLNILLRQCDLLEQDLDDEDPPLWDIEDVSAYLNVSVRTVENLIAGGEIVPLRVRSLRRFDPETIKTWVRQSIQ